MGAGRSAGSPTERVVEQGIRRVAFAWGKAFGGGNRHCRASKVSMSLVSVELQGCWREPKEQRGRR